MKKFAFYLHPKGKAAKNQSTLSFSVIVSENIEQAVVKFSELSKLVYCGVLKVTSDKYYVYFDKKVADVQEELMYIVIEDQESSF